MKTFLNKILILACLASLGFSTQALANNLSISNISFGNRNLADNTVSVSFDVSWSNSWRNKINHDAAWLTVRLNNPTVSPTAKKLCQVSASGLNPTGSSIGTASNLEFYVPADKRGAFLRRSSNGALANVSTTNAQLTINYESCGFSDSDQIYASIQGIEMVLIPQGSFYAGDYNTSTASLNKGSADNSPWDISSESAVVTSNPASGGYRYVSNANAGENATGAIFTIPAAYPKGYGAFYVMKYEINEGQWVEFLNALPSNAARSNRDVTDNNHKNSDSVVNRNTVACSGTPLTCTTQRPNRAMTFLSWMDIAAFLDWNALRPMTELEFEKIARGPALPVSGEYAWGTTDITAASALTGSNEDGSETVSTLNANAQFNNTTISGGDASLGVSSQTGALRNGVFATATSTRITAGASYYGVMELSGNAAERIITIGNSNGLAFTGTHGDGSLTSLSGYEGNADAANWPGLDATVARGVTGAAGSGLRGGSWADASGYLKVSDRSSAALTDTSATAMAGGRGVRTYDGN